MAKTTTTAVSAVPQGKTANVRRFELTADVRVFAQGLGVDLDASRDDRADQAAAHINRSQRHMLATGLLLASIKAECEHGEFADLITSRGFEERAARTAMQYAGFVMSRSDSERAQLVELGYTKVIQLAGADPEVIDAMLDDGVDKIDALSVRALRHRIAELEAGQVDLQVQRDTAEAEAAGLKKRLQRGLPDRGDGLPVVVAELRAEIMALGKKAGLALDSFTPLGVDLMLLRGADGGCHDWADATLRLAFAQLQALQVQLQGLVGKYLTGFGNSDTRPVDTSHLTQQEMQEAAECFETLTQAHTYEAKLREWQREQARPRGKGRPSAKPVAPDGVAP